MEDSNTPKTEAAQSQPVQPQAVVQPAAAPAAPVEELVDIAYFAKLKFRVARVESVELVPKSKKLVKMQVDLGPQFGKRQILAGIAPYYAIETLIGKKIVVVANLKPATLMGHQSQGMLLAAMSPDGASLGVLTPDKDLPEGSEVR